MSTPDAFDSIIESLVSDQDPGEVAFRERLIASELIVNGHDGNSEGVENEQLISLNSEWGYHHAELIIAGRVYLAKDDYQLPIKGSWGEVIEDGTGTYCHVTDAPLISYGIAPVQAADGTTRFVYALTDTDTSDETPFVAYPEDVDIQYPYPTADGIDKFLHARWPAEMTIIDDVLSRFDGDYVSLFRNLEATKADIAKASHDSDEFNKWLPGYLYAKIGFGNQGEMEVEVVNRVRLKKTSYDESGQVSVVPVEQTLSESRPFTFESPSKFAAEVVGLFVANNQGEHADEIKYGLFLETRATSDGEPYLLTIICSTESVTDIWSKLVEFDFDGEQLSSPGDNKDVRPHIGRVAAGFENASDIIEVLPTHQREYARLQRVAAVLEEIKQEAMNARRTFYPTLEAAIGVSKDLVVQFLQRLEAVGAKNYDVLEVSGIGVLAPSAKVERPEPNVIQISIDSEAPISRLAVGHSIGGTYTEEIQPGHLQAVSSDGSIQYAPMPRLVIGIKYYQADLSGELGMMPFSLHQRALAELDDDTQFSLPKLELLQSQIDAITKMKLSYGEHPVAEILHGVHNKMFDQPIGTTLDVTADVHDFLSIFPSIEKPDDALDAFRALFRKETVSLMYADGANEEGGYFKGKIIDVLDVNPRNNTEEIVFVAEPHEQEKPDMPYFVLPVKYIRYIEL